MTVLLGAPTTGATKQGYHSMTTATCEKIWTATSTQHLLKTNQP